MKDKQYLRPRAPSRCRVTVGKGLRVRAIGSSSSVKDQAQIDSALYSNRASKRCQHIKTGSTRSYEIEQ